MLQFSPLQDNSECKLSVNQRIRYRTAAPVANHRIPSSAAAGNFLQIILFLGFRAAERILIQPATNHYWQLHVWRTDESDEWIDFDRPAHPPFIFGQIKHRPPLNVSFQNYPQRTELILECGQIPRLGDRLPGPSRAWQSNCRDCRSDWVPAHRPFTPPRHRPPYCGYHCTGLYARNVELLL